MPSLRWERCTGGAPGPGVGGRAGGRPSRSPGLSAESDLGSPSQAGRNPFIQRDATSQQLCPLPAPHKAESQV